MDCVSCFGLQLLFRFAGSYFFLVCSSFFFSFCGLRNRLDVSIFFGCCWFVIYFVAVLISYRRLECFCFQLQFLVVSLALCFFKMQFLKSYQSLQRLPFVAAVFGLQGGFVCVHTVVAVGLSYCFFIPGAFEFLNSLRNLIEVVGDLLFSF